MNDITLGSPTNGTPISVSVLLMALTPMTCGGVSHYRIVTGSLSDHYLITHWATLPQCGRTLWRCQLHWLGIIAFELISSSKIHEEMRQIYIDSSEEWCWVRKAWKLSKQCTFLKFRIGSQVKIEFQTTLVFSQRYFHFRQYLQSFSFSALIFTRLNPLVGSLHNCAAHSGFTIVTNRDTLWWLSIFFYCKSRLLQINFTCRQYSQQWNDVFKVNWAAY